MLEYLKTNIFFSFAILFFIILPIILTFSLGYSFNSSTGGLDNTLNLSMESSPLFSKIIINNQVINEFGKVDINLNKDKFFVANITKDKFLDETFKFISPKNQNSNIRISPVTLLPNAPKQIIKTNQSDVLIDNHVFSFNDALKQISHKNLLQTNQLSPENIVNIYGKLDITSIASNAPNTLKLESLNDSCYYDKENQLILNYKNLSSPFGVNFKSDKILNKPKYIFCLENSLVFINQFNQLWTYNNQNEQFTFLDDGVKQLFVTDNKAIWIIKSDILYQMQINNDKQVNLVKIYQSIDLLNEIKELEVLNFIQGSIIRLDSKVIQVFSDQTYHVLDNQAKLVTITNKGVAIYNQNNQLLVWNLFNKQQKIINLPNQSKQEVIKIVYNNDLKRFFIHSKQTSNTGSDYNYTINSIWLDYEQLNPLIIEYSNITWIKDQKNCNKNLISKIQYCQSQEGVSVWNTENII